VLSGRGLCDWPIPRPEESYRLWCVSECDQVKIKTFYTNCEQVGRRGKDYETKQQFTVADWYSGSSLTANEVHVVTVSGTTRQRTGNVRAETCSNRQLTFKRVSLMLFCRSVIYVFVQSTILLNTTVLLIVLHIRYVVRQNRTIFKRMGNLFKLQLTNIFHKRVTSKRSRTRIYLCTYDLLTL
jgi:hypothetical protein